MLIYLLLGPDGCAACEKRSAFSRLVQIPYLAADLGGPPGPGQGGP